MTDPVTVALIGAAAAVLGTLPATLAALAARRSSHRTGKKADVIGVQTTQIKLDVNGNLAGLKQELTAANQRIEVLVERLLVLTAFMTPPGHDHPPVDPQPPL